MKREQGDLCRTPEEAFDAGWRDGAADEPLTPSEIDRLVALHSRHLIEPAA